MKKVSVIGSGFSGMAAACYLAHQGHRVSVFEKNESPGGRARKFEEQGFVFDMGPSWYWMPDVFERFFNDFGYGASDYFELIKLDPGFQIFFGNKEKIALPASLDAVYDLFESIEHGSAAKLKQFLKEGEDKYRIGMLDFAYKPSLSWTEYATVKVLSRLFSTDLFRSMKNYVRQFFKDERLIKLMEFPVLFLGAMPKDIPALYSLMNFSAISQGTYYPQGGMHRLVEGLYKTANSLGVEFLFDHPVSKIHVQKGLANSLKSNSSLFDCDAIIASSDIITPRSGYYKMVLCVTMTKAIGRRKSWRHPALFFM